MDKVTGHSKRFGFVEMKNDQEANSAIKDLNECEFDHSEIVVKKARPREENTRRDRNDNQSRDRNARYW